MNPKTYYISNEINYSKRHYTCIFSLMADFIDLFLESDERTLALQSLKAF